MKSAAILVGCLVLTACAGDEDDSSASSPPTAPDDRAIATTDPATVPCPEAAAPPAITGPKKTPSPVEQCEGRYLCMGMEGKGPTGAKIWLHFDGKQCLFGEYSTVLHSDGTVTKDDERGTWTGDAAYFRVNLKGIAYYYDAPMDYTTCQRDEE